MFVDKHDKVAIWSKIQQLSHAMNEILVSLQIYPVYRILAKFWPKPQDNIASDWGICNAWILVMGNFYILELGLCQAQRVIFGLILQLSFGVMLHDSLHAHLMYALNIFYNELHVLHKCQFIMRNISWISCCNVCLTLCVMEGLRKYASACTEQVMSSHVKLSKYLCPFKSS